MHFSSSLITALFFLCSESSARADIRGRDLNSFVDTERAIALQGVLNNIGPNGSQVPGTAAGLIIASPSKTDPDYFFTWSRDSALTIKMIVDEFILGNGTLEPIINDYIKAQAVLQTVSNPSGTFLPAGRGLGEPKYEADGTRFNGAWGRPQRDGPALRAIALITYSDWLLRNGQSQKAKRIIWPIIQNDLAYVGQYWNQTGFDLWEEVQGSSFFTTLNQYRSLVEGTKLARDLGVTCSSCFIAPSILCLVQNFWNGQYIDANINVDEKRSGLDSNSILASISVFDIDAYCDSPTFQPCNSKSLANFKVLVDSFRAYPINSGVPAGKGVAIGRYPEDIYFGGNPWYLTITAAAEFLYDAVAQWKARHNLFVDDISLAFFKELYPDVTIRQYNSGNENSPFSQIMDAVTAYADSFLALSEQYTPTDGSLSEQIDKNSGLPLSARDLTWSYAAFITLSQRRLGQYPKTWGTRQADPLPSPSNCTVPSYTGTYVPAVAAGAPNSTIGCSINILFNLNASTYYGENIYITGNTTELGGWDLGLALPLSAGGYTQDRPLWSLDAYFEVGAVVDYKFVRQEDCGQAWVYEGVNRTVDVGVCGSADEVEELAWDGPVGTSGNC